jgi:hypothetical protein
MPTLPPAKRPGWVVPVIAGLVVLLIATAAVAVYGWTRPLAPASGSPATTTRTTTPATAVVTTPPKPVYTPPSAADFALTVKVLKKTCFGSAGCNINYNIEVMYTGKPTEPGQTWDVTYEITGGDDPQINTFQFTSTSSTEYNVLVPREEHIQTPSSDSVLTATVTAVSRH